MNNKALIWAMNVEKEKKDRSGVYGYIQRTMAYNSNKIEGSTLTPGQTASLFEEGFLPASDEPYVAKDVEEMRGHFLMFNKMLSSLNEPLTDKLIKELHYELKAGVFEDRANGYAVGEYKQRANYVGNIQTAAPADVSHHMTELLNWYNGHKHVTIQTLAEFHARYEKIHPFQDGNGRTGRMLLFRECLVKDIVPFIITDKNRIKYISALQIAQNDNDISKLATYFEQEQKEFESIYRNFGIQERYQQALFEMCNTENKKNLFPIMG